MERLRESFLFDTKDYSQLDEQQISSLQITKPKLTESQKYTETDLLSAASVLRESLLTENDKQLLDKIINRLKEDGVKNQFSVWKLPIGRYGNINGNKRIYPKKLWENVRDKQHGTWKNFCGLCDHPVADNDPGEFKNQAVIWHDMDIGDSGVVYGIGSFIGPYGHLAQEILEHGGRVGTSSSGFGDVDKYSHEVDPNTYIIERLADLVLNPSQGTFGTAAECPHTASEFLNDVHGGATIEFNKQKVKEAQSAILRRKYMADQTNPQVYDAANPGAAPVKPAANANGAQQTSAAPAQPGAPIKESVEMSQKGTLTKVEEKAFRKYVQTFIADANKMDNPIQRLNECVDILGCFDEGNCPDLKQQLEEQLMKEKVELEKLVENVISTEKDYEMPLTQFREAAERNTAQGILLKEQVTDFKELCEGLSARNIELKEEVSKLQKIIRIKDKLTEKKITKSNQEIVGLSSAEQKLQEENEQLKEKNRQLIEKSSKLALSNKEFEKENGVLVTKIKEAGQIMKNIKLQEEAKAKKDATISNGIKQLQEKIALLETENKKLTDGFKEQNKEYGKLQESFEAYKKEVNNTYNPTANLMPKFEERVGKYMNLREHKGIEVESYWADLKEKYGDVVDRFEDQIRGAKTLREATSAFLKYRTEIDPDFATAQPAEYAFRNRSERAKLYEHQGILNPIDSYSNSTLEQKNEAFLATLKAQNLQ